MGKYRIISISRIQTRCETHLWILTLLLIWWSAGAGQINCRW